MCAQCTNERTFRAWLGLVAELAGMIGRDDVLALDAADPLEYWRDEFVVPDPNLIYLDGNSLGRTPKRTVVALHRVIDEWAGDLIASWWEHDWLNLALTVGDELAPLLGAGQGEVAVHESTTIGIFQQINVALDLVADRRVIAIDDTDFPTDRYAVEGVARLRNCEIRHGLDDLDGVDVVVRSLVDYRTAEVTDLAGETARAAAHGRHHGVGSLPCGWRARTRPAGGERRTRSGVHLQVPQRRARAHRHSSSWQRMSSSGWSNRSGDGSHNPTSSRWSGHSILGPASDGC